jgi:hypothetical protein
MLWKTPGGGTQARLRRWLASVRRIWAQGGKKNSFRVILRLLAGLAWLVRHHEHEYCIMNGMALHAAAPCVFG